MNKIRDPVASASKPEQGANVELPKPVPEPVKSDTQSRRAPPAPKGDARGDDRRDGGPARGGRHDGGRGGRRDKGHQSRLSDGYRRDGFQNGGCGERRHEGPRGFSNDGDQRRDHPKKGPVVGPAQKNIALFFSSNRAGSASDKPPVQPVQEQVKVAPESVKVAAGPAWVDYLGPIVGDVPKDITPAKAAELLGKPCLADAIEKVPMIPAPDAKVKPDVLLALSMEIAGFFIEQFVSDQPEELSHVAVKWLDMKVMTANLPIPIPVAFHTPKNKDGDRILLGFYNNSVISAVDCRDIAQKAVDRIKGRQMLIAEMKKVDNDLVTKAYLNDLSMLTGCPVLATEGAVDEETETRDWTLRVLLPSNASEAKECEDEVKRFYDRCRMELCKNCKLVFGPHDQSECVQLYHPGHRVEIEPGVMEITDWDEEEEEAFTVVCYSCCGEVDEDDPGCTEKHMGRHQREKDFSTLEMRRGKFS